MALHLQRRSEKISRPLLLHALASKRGWLRRQKVRRADRDDRDFGFPRQEARRPFCRARRRQLQNQSSNAPPATASSPAHPVAAQPRSQAARSKNQAFGSSPARVKRDDQFPE